MTKAHQHITNLQAAINKVVVGQSEVIEKIIIGVLCDGNLLLEGLPGTAKTRAVKTLATLLQVEMGRIQFTPDLLPADITGTEIYHSRDGDVGSAELVFQPGPIFSNLILADEINRAPAKVQSALLEAMEERQVTVAGKTYPLPEFFMVLATQNPIEQDGTYPLPEAQLDRFLMKVNVAHPSAQAELEIIRLVRGEQSDDADILPSTVAGVEPIFTARQEIAQIHVSEHVENYIVALVIATREPTKVADSPLSNWLTIGVSPRASISLERAARARAWLQGRDYVDPDDVRAMLPAVFSHRLILSYTAQSEGVTTDDVIKEIIEQVAVA